MLIEERNKIVQENLALIPYCLKLLNVEYNEDYFQQGVLELIRCVENFKEEEGKKFSTYAVTNLKWYLKEYIQRDKVIRPKRIKPRCGKVDKLSIDSLDKEIYCDGKPIMLGDTLINEHATNEFNNLIYDLDSLIFFDWVLENYDLQKDDLNIFLDYNINGWDKKRVLGKKYNISTGELTVILNRTREILQKAYLAYNKIEEEGSS